MKKIFFYILFIFLFFNIEVNSKENFFEEAKNKFDQKKIEDSKFLFQRNIVFNPKNEMSYLYLAKIYKEEKNIEELEKNLNTTLLLDPKNENALFMLIELEIDKSNFDSVKELTKTFSLICSKLCDKKKILSKKIKDLEPKNESQ